MIGAAFAVCVCQGVNPNLGRSNKIELSTFQQMTQQQVQLRPAAKSSADGSAPGFWQARPSSSTDDAQDPPPPQPHDFGPKRAPKFSPEEVLMYHRAASRMAELCHSFEC